MWSETGKNGRTQADGCPGQTSPVGSEAAHECRALVAIRPAVSRTGPARRATASFLAQLIAVKDQHPQARERRRAEPREALAAYASTAALTRF